jgi:hypothetical protein
MICISIQFGSYHARAEKIQQVYLFGMIATFFNFLSHIIMN